jgi:hypothetical protein
LHHVLDIAGWIGTASFLPSLFRLATKNGVSNSKSIIVTLSPTPVSNVSITLTSTTYITFEPLIVTISLGSSSAIFVASSTFTSTPSSQFFNAIMSSNDVLYNGIITQKAQFTTVTPGQSSLLSPR